MLTPDSRYNTITRIITVFWVGLLASCNTLAFVAGHLNFLQFYKWVQYRLKCFNFEIWMQFEMLFCLKQSWITICEVYLLNDKYGMFMNLSICSDYILYLQIICAVFDILAWSLWNTKTDYCFIDVWWKVKSYTFFLNR